MQGIGPTRRSRLIRLTGAAGVAAMLAAGIVAGPTLASNPATGIDVTLPGLTTYSIGGIITRTNGTPVAGVDVFASGAGGAGFATTDPTGAYTVGNLPAGSYRLLVTPTSDPTLESGYYAAVGASHFTPLLAGSSAVGIGPSRTKVNIKLPTGSTISGKVLDPKGHPVTSATVIAAASGFFPHATQTSGDGSFSLAGLPQAKYTLRVSVPHGVNLQSGYYVSTGSTHFTVTSSHATTISVPPNRAKLSMKLPTGYTISGKIVDSSGVPVGGASVVASSPIFASFASTAPNGTYKLVGLSPGSYRIGIIPAQPSVLLGGYYAATAGTHYSLTSSHAAPVSVGPNKTGVNVKLPKGVSISGKITDTKGAPVEGVTVRAGGSSTQTAANGTYMLIGLLPGKYRVSFGAPAPTGPSDPHPTGLQSGWYGGPPPNHFSASIAGSTQLTVGASVANVNARLPDGSEITGTISTIVSSVKIPVAFASVTATDSSASASTSTGFDGTYTIYGLSPGSWVIHVAPLPLGQVLASGWYDRNVATTHYTNIIGAATPVKVP